MRNKKIVIGIALLLVVLLLGIGYAATTKTLKITATAEASYKAENFNVIFTGATVNDSNTTTAVISNEDKTKATMTVKGLTTKGQSATATFEVTNNSDELLAELSDVLVSSTNNEYFNVTAVINKAEGETKVKMNPADKRTVTVTVTLAKTPVDNVSENFDITFDATPVVAE